MPRRRSRNRTGKLRQKKSQEAATHHNVVQLLHRQGPDLASVAQEQPDPGQRKGRMASGGSVLQGECRPLPKRPGPLAAWALQEAAGAFPFASVEIPDSEVYLYWRAVAEIERGDREKLTGSFGRTCGNGPVTCGSLRTAGCRKSWSVSRARSGGNSIHGDQGSCVRSALCPTSRRQRPAGGGGRRQVGGPSSAIRRRIRVVSSTRILRSCRNKTMRPARRPGHSPGTRPRGR